MNKKLAIIGAGPAGLATAYFLAKKGIKLVVFESSKSVGGLAGSINFSGRNFDIGPHIFLESSQKEAVDFWKEIAGKDIISMDLSRGMILNNKTIDFPPKPQGLLRAYGVFSFSIAAFSILKARMFAKNNFTEAGSFFEKRYGNFFRKKVFNPFCVKYMGVADSRTDLNFALGLTSFVKEAKRENVETDEGKLKRLIYPKGGTKIIWDRIASFVQMNGQIQLEKKIVGIKTHEDKIKSLSFNDGNETQVDLVVSSLPIVVLLKLLKDTPIEILEEIRKLNYRNTVLVYLKVEAKAFGHHYVTVFDHSLEAGRITNFDVWKETRSDDNVICIEYWCDEKDENWTCSDEEIIRKAINEMEASGLIPKNKTTNAKVLRLQRSHPKLDLDHIAILKKANDFLKKYKNLMLTGRHATFKWDGQADNICAGMEIAEAISKNWNI